ncbi:MAG: 50S ribosomal protein L10 [Proteobacteria bacterium]|nr:50S ribosomal protein L10 [Pseudomonadota bacterium]
MNRTEKQEIVDDLNKTFADAASVVVTHYRGINVSEMDVLRQEMREAGARFRVTKNRLVKRALEGTPYSTLSGLFEGPTAIAYSDDPVAAARVAVAYAKKNDKLIVVGGAMGEIVLDVAGVNTVASLPSLDELRATLIALLNTPATQLAVVVRAPAAQLARVLAAHGSQEPEAAET